MNLLNCDVDMLNIRGGRRRRDYLIERFNFFWVFVMCMYDDDGQQSNNYFHRSTFFLDRRNEIKSIFFGST